MSTVTFLLRMTLEQAITINKQISILNSCIKSVHDTRLLPDFGYIKICKDTIVGLYDPWYGIVSCLGIQLERDITIPIKFVWSALPDKNEKYSALMNNLTSTAWKSSIQEIHSYKAA